MASPPLRPAGHAARRGDVEAYAPAPTSGHLSGDSPSVDDLLALDAHRRGNVAKRDYISIPIHRIERLAMSGPGYAMGYAPGFGQDCPSATDGR